MIKYNWTISFSNGVGIRKDSKDGYDFIKNIYDKGDDLYIEIINLKDSIITINLN